MKVLTIVGARPQFVKAAAVSGPLRRRATEVLLHTGQHYDAAMSDRFFDELALPAPDVHLGVGSGTHAAQTAAMLTGIEAAILSERPNRVLVYGDTNSTLAGALAAAKLDVPLVHVEAGLRSFDRGMPEEINRVLTDHVSALLCCPGEAAARNLRAEGITSGVHVTGDVMRDVLDRARPQVTADRVAAMNLVPDGYLLLTVHRARNADDPAVLSRILDGVARAGLPVVFPVHPRTKRVLCSARVPPTIRAIDPVGYLDMLALQRYGRAVVTDSGGVQKEAYWLGVPCVTVRDETEWVETVDAGANQIAGTMPSRIAAAVASAAFPASAPPLYGDGAAGERVATLVAGT